MDLKTNIKIRRDCKSVNGLTLRKNKMYPITRETPLYLCINVGNGEDKVRKKECGELYRVVVR